MDLAVPWLKRSKLYAQRRAAPQCRLLGEHRAEALAEDLDLREEEIRALRDQGAIAE